MESLLTTIADYLWSQSWQIALLVAVVALASWALRNRSAHVRYLLWLLVLAKCLTPPVVEVPLAVLPDRGPPTVAPIISTVPPQEEVTQTPVEERLPPPPTSAAPEPLHLATRQWLAVGWLAGVAVFTCVALTKAARTILWLRRERRMLPRTSGDSFEETFRSLRVKRPPHIWLIEGVGQPFVWGILRGDIYLPNHFAGIDDQHRRDILAHEISHVLRFDAAVNILQIIAQAIFWFHPLLWWANQRIRREREKCCDEMAIAHLGARPKDYSSAIVSTLIQAQESIRPVPSLAVAGPVKNIEERIRAMLRPGKRFHTRPSLVAAAVVLLIALLTIPTALVLTARGQTQPTAQSADKPAADSKKPEQPRFAARTFNSKLALDVWVVREGDVPRSIGHTPSAAPLRIPACSLWLAQPTVPVENWDLLITEMSRNSIPGLKLEPATDSDLRHIAGLGGLQFLDLSGTSVTDAGLAQLKGLTRLEWLDLTGTPVTDAGLAHLKGMTGLQELNLHRTRITGPGLAHLKDMTRLRNLRLDTTDLTDTGLEHLKGLKGLEQLKLSYTLITDAGIAHLKGLTALRELYLPYTKITDEGLAHLKGLTRLKMLSLGYTHITDAGLVHLKDLTGLTWLNLAYARIRGAGLEHLRGLPDLISLDLTETLITDAGMEHLKRLSGLQVVWLDGTWVTDAGRRQLKESLPKLSIGEQAK